MGEYVCLEDDCARGAAEQTKPGGGCLMGHQDLLVYLRTSWALELAWQSKLSGPPVSHQLGQKAAVGVPPRRLAAEPLLSMPATLSAGPPAGPAESEACRATSFHACHFFFVKVRHSRQHMTREGRAFLGSSGSRGSTQTNDCLWQ